MLAGFWVREWVRVDGVFAQSCETKNYNECCGAGLSRWVKQTCPGPSWQVGDCSQVDAACGSTGGGQQSQTCGAGQVWNGSGCTNISSGEEQNNQAAAQQQTNVQSGDNCSTWEACGHKESRCSVQKMFNDTHGNGFEAWKGEACEVTGAKQVNGVAVGGTNAGGRTDLTVVGPLGNECYCKNPETGLNDKCTNLGGSNKLCCDTTRFPSWSGSSNCVEGGYSWSNIDNTNPGACLAWNGVDVVESGSCDDRGGQTQICKNGVYYTPGSGECEATRSCYLASGANACESKTAANCGLPRAHESKTDCLRDAQQFALDESGGLSAKLTGKWISINNGSGCRACTSSDPASRCVYENKGMCEAAIAREPGVGVADITAADVEVRENKLVLIYGQECLNDNGCLCGSRLDGSLGQREINNREICQPESNDWVDVVSDNTTVPEVLQFGEAKGSCYRSEDQRGIAWADQVIDPDEALRACTYFDNGVQRLTYECKVGWVSNGLACERLSVDTGRGGPVQACDVKDRNSIKGAVSWLGEDKTCNDSDGCDCYGLVNSPAAGSYQVTCGMRCQERLAVVNVNGSDDFIFATQGKQCSRSSSQRGDELNTENAIACWYYDGGVDSGRKIGTRECAPGYSKVGNNCVDQEANLAVPNQTSTNFCSFAGDGVKTNVQRDGSRCFDSDGCVCKHSVNPALDVEIACGANCSPSQARVTDVGGEIVSQSTADEVYPLCRGGNDAYQPLENADVSPGTSNASYCRYLVDDVSDLYETTWQCDPTYVKSEDGLTCRKDGLVGGALDQVNWVRSDLLALASRVTGREVCYVPSDGCRAVSTENCSESVHYASNERNRCVDERNERQVIRAREAALRYASQIRPCVADNHAPIALDGAAGMCEFEGEAQWYCPGDLFPVGNKCVSIKDDTNGDGGVSIDEVSPDFCTTPGVCVNRSGIAGIAGEFCNFDGSVTYYPVCINSNDASDNQRLEQLTGRYRLSAGSCVECSVGQIEDGMVCNFTNESCSNDVSNTREGGADQNTRQTSCYSTRSEPACNRPLAGGNECDGVVTFADQNACIVAAQASGDSVAENCYFAENGCEAAIYRCDLPNSYPQDRYDECIVNAGARSVGKYCFDESMCPGDELECQGYRCVIKEPVGGNYQNYCYVLANGCEQNVIELSVCDNVETFANLQSCQIMLEKGRMGL